MPTVLVHHGLPLGIDDSRVRGRRDDLQVRRPDDEATFQTSVEEATVLLVSNATWSDAYLGGLDGGDWIQSVSAGNDRVPLDALRERGVTFARGTVHGPTAAEHALALLRGVPAFRNRQH